MTCETTFRFMTAVDPLGSPSGWGEDPWSFYLVDLPAIRCGAPGMGTQHSASRPIALFDYVSDVWRIESQLIIGDLGFAG